VQGEVARLIEGLKVSAQITRQVFHTKTLVGVILSLKSVDEIFKPIASSPLTKQKASPGRKRKPEVFHCSE